MRLASLPLVLLLFMPGAGAGHCVAPFLDRHSEELRITDPETGQVLYYVDNDPCQLEGCGFSVWIYPEANGYENLQRQDAPEHEMEGRPWLQDDTCHGMIHPDITHFLL